MALSVWSRGASAVTVTVVVACPTASCRSTRRRLSHRNRDSVADQLGEARRNYRNANSRPRPTPGPYRLPTPVVTVEFCVPIAVLVTVILAPAIAEPDGSVTIPDILPRSSCAKHNWLAQHSTMNIRLKLMNLSQLSLRNLVFLMSFLASNEMQNA